MTGGQRYSVPHGETIKLVLFAVMAVSLALVVIAGAVFLIWNGQPIGNSASMVADVFAWLFTAAFVIAFLLSMFEQRRTAIRYPDTIRHGASGPGQH